MCCINLHWHSPLSDVPSLSSPDLSTRPPVNHEVRDQLSLCNLLFLLSFCIWIPKVKLSILIFWVDHFRLNSAKAKPVFFQPLSHSYLLLFSVFVKSVYLSASLLSHFPASLSFVLSESLNFLFTTSFYSSVRYCYPPMPSMVCLSLLLCVFFCLTLEIQFAQENMTRQKKYIS